MAQFEDLTGTLNASMRPEACILCRNVPPEGESTLEHVFPKWLQHRFKLWNATLTLLNGTGIPYRYLTVTACRKCNSEYLSPIEDAVSAAVAAGYDAVRRLSHLLLTQWLSKIFLGILLKECSLRIVRSKPDAGFIFTSDEMEQYNLLSYWLNTCRWRVSDGPSPSSIIVCRAKVPPDVKNQFDFRDSLQVFRRVIE